MPSDSAGSLLGTRASSQRTLSAIACLVLGVGRTAPSKAAS